MIKRKVTKDQFKHKSLLNLAFKKLFGKIVIEIIKNYIKSNYENKKILSIFTSTNNDNYFNCYISKFISSK